MSISPMINSERALSPNAPLQFHAASAAARPTTQEKAAIAIRKTDFMREPPVRHRNVSKTAVAVKDAPLDEKLEHASDVWQCSPGCVSRCRHDESLVFVWTPRGKRVGNSAYLACREAGISLPSVL